ncbi:Zn-dependent exopeptidase [Neocallimastix californiae]|uniref:Zn-dependent exopeptidase n=1 Tax=Neocallimastix californiae TaxID=1754190 RepID=A0A1Y2FAZ3_9FUNG|nr:Zn-dependent exopeptidase [Neocallimastix californiae]|eukprot:ORY81078.1 Zn-dependent exopeptidase [Neocallimastix californiae]
MKTKIFVKKYKSDIDTLKKNNSLSDILTHEVIGESLIKNHIDLLTITNKKINNINKKGFIEFILGNSEEAKFLRNKYIIKIIPMLNPDGVITGNSRCSLTGYDLNRCWRLSKKKLLKYSPEIYHAIEMIQKTVVNNDIEMFVDMHGHSRKFGTFLYGCNNDDNDKNRCHFNIEKVKEGTGRVFF